MASVFVHGAFRCALRPKGRRGWLQVWQRLDKNFHTLMRSLLTIGAGLSQANEIRDLFLDITDKVRPHTVVPAGALHTLPQWQR